MPKPLLCTLPELIMSRFGVRRYAGLLGCVPARAHRSEGCLADLFNHLRSARTRVPLDGVQRGVERKDVSSYALTSMLLCVVHCTRAKPALFPRNGPTAPSTPVQNQHACLHTIQLREIKSSRATASTNFRYSVEWNRVVSAAMQCHI